MIKTISRTLDTILVIDDSGKSHTARADHPKWKELCELFDRISYVPHPIGTGGFFSGPTVELVDTMDMKTAIETYTVGLLSVNALGVTYEGKPLHTTDAERLMAFMRDKLSYKPIANYIANKMRNTSARAIKEMYNFLEHKGMPLTLRGTFIAYKGVSLDFWSIRGNNDTVILQGKVNASGQILNTIGATIEVERSSVDDDFREGCSTGLHVGSLAYAKDWGKRVVLVEVDPADVVSVPEDCECQKLRCCKYTVVAEYSGPMPDTLTTEFDSDEDDEDYICHQCGNPTDDCTCNEDDANRMGMAETPDACGCEHCIRKLENPTPPDDSAPLSDTYKKVISIIVEQFGYPEHMLKPDTKMNYDSLGMDSLDSVELCMALEDEFQIEISDEMVETYIDCTIGKIVKDIEDYLAKTGSPLLPNVTINMNQSYVIGVSDGKIQKAIDIGMNLHNPKYWLGDENGSDSDSHAAYIRGYVWGYNFKSSQEA